MLKWILAIIVIVGGCKTPPTTETRVKVIFTEITENPSLEIESKILWKG